MKTIKRTSSPPPVFLRGVGTATRRLLKKKAGEAKQSKK